MVAPVERQLNSMGTHSSIPSGCDIRHASHLTHSRGFDLRFPAAASPIGFGCTAYVRPAGPQRAFPRIGKAVAVDEHVARSPLIR
jgi:XRE family transcriptional regulator, fatty acid utilization regulator